MKKVFKNTSIKKICLSILVICIAVAAGYSINQYKNKKYIQNTYPEIKDLIRMKFENDIRYNPFTTQVFQDTHNDMLFYTFNCATLSEQKTYCDIRKYNLSDIYNYTKLENGNPFLVGPQREKILYSENLPAGRLLQWLGIDGDKLLFHYGFGDDSGRLVKCSDWNPYIDSVDKMNGEIFYINTAEENPTPHQYKITPEIRNNFQPIIKKCTDTYNREMEENKQLFREYEKTLSQ